jgi:hypothetical protein
MAELLGWAAGLINILPAATRVTAAQGVNQTDSIPVGLLQLELSAHDDGAVWGEVEDLGAVGCVVVHPHVEPLAPASEPAGAGPRPPTEVVPVVRVLFDGERLAQLFTPTEARELAQVLVALAARAHAG